jgi:hypothetical protein
MLKKILFLLFLLISVSAFSQQKSIAKLSTAPNPFFDYTFISYNSNKTQNVILNIINVLGKVVFTKTYEALNGENNIQFYKNDLPSGMYIYTIEDSNNRISKRFVIK